MGLARYTRRTLAGELALVLAAVVFCLPFYLLVGAALDTTAQASKTPLVFPWPPHFGNFGQAWSKGGQGGLGHPLEASLIITVSSVAGLVVLGSLCAYTLARRTGRLSRALYLAFVLGILLPGAVATVPIYVAMRQLGLVGNYLGIIVLNIGLSMPFTVFVYTSFIRALPRDYEEAARVDGASTLLTWRRVVLPQLLPITATIAILLGVTIWNEFFIALIYLSGSRIETLPVALYTHFGDYGSQTVLFAGVAITVAPALAFYLFAQRRLIRGIATGIKG